MHSKIVVASFLALAGCTTAEPLPPDDVPAALQAPAGERLVLRVHAQGTQSYECTAAGDHGEWKFKGPNAVLNGDRDALIGIHYGGPTWEAVDGSKVVGALVASVPAADGHSIPQLLLKAKATSGDGTFSRIRSIQRLETRGGEAPGTQCGVADAGRKVDVPYSAVYVFYGARD